MNNFFRVFLILLVGLSITNHASAQTSELPPGPVYTVQDGDTLWEIAYIFHVDVNELVAYNKLSSLDIYIGNQLVIPGLEHLSGILSVQPISFGETLRSISRQNGSLPELIIDLNHLVTPAELFAGSRVILLLSPDSSVPLHRASLSRNLTTLDFVVEHTLNSWSLSRKNNIDGPTLVIPGDIFTFEGGFSTSTPSGYPLSFAYVEIDPLPIFQGDTVQISLFPMSEAIISGSLGSSILHFFPNDDGSLVGLQGIHAMIEPGIYPLKLTALDSSGAVQSFEQMVLIGSGNFPEDPALYVDESLIDPAVTEPENEWLFSITNSATSIKYWTEIFLLPVASDNFCLRSSFGNRRSYNGGELIGFHTGLDYGVCSESHPFDIYSPANGQVIFVGNKTVRGNVSIIDHGWGIYSGFWHQEEIFVSIGEEVVAGQLIGTIGSTGRVTGPHLHWELWVNGIQVNPQKWLDVVFPH